MMAYSIEVKGLVQGVGFRPYVYGLASKLGLRGWVRNETGGVVINLQGEQQLLDSFLYELSNNPPRLAQIAEVRCTHATPEKQPRFEIVPSAADLVGEIVVGPDVATCDACLRDLFDPHNRRYRYPFVACTECGPRLSTIKSMPYDREQTSWHLFPMCAECRSEYENPRDRRFHAQGIGCHACGPHLIATDSTGQSVASKDDAVDWAVQALRAGKIAAIKSLAGFHLACDPLNEETVAQLRRRKKRDQKPFALMFETLEEVRRACDVSESEGALLQSYERPIVLLKRREDWAIAKSVAPENPFVGVMLPSTGLHHLLLREFGRPLVMTSGNPSEQPMVYRDGDAYNQLVELADFFLMHNLPIENRCDDSVTRVIGAKRVFLRRSRGFAPSSLPLPIDCKAPVLAMGGQLKASFALGRGRQAIVSHHLGDLDQYESCREYARAIEHYERLLSIEPELLAHDLHPDYTSTRQARELSLARNKPTIAIQHHHAHMASCMADNGIRQAVIGITFDGTGLGSDGTVWGGEFLVGDFYSFQRAAHFRCVRMPGGEQAIREPWRMGLAHIRDAGENSTRLSAEVSDHVRRLVEQMIDTGFNAPFTSSCGRFLDAIASIIGVRHRAAYEGEPAMQLEFFAMESRDRGSYPFELDGSRPVRIDTRPCVAAVMRDCFDRVPKATIARRVHTTLIEMIVQTCRALRSGYGICAVALSGGVFMNGILADGATRQLELEGFQVFRHAQVPPNDGGLSLGQLAIAAASQEHS